MPSIQDTIEYKLVRDAMLLDISIIESDIKPTVGDEDWVVRMQLQVDEELVDSCAHGLVYADGKVRLETVNRGKAAPGWVAKLQGKKLLQPVSP